MKPETGRGAEGIRARANRPPLTERERRAWRALMRKAKIARANVRAFAELHAARGAEHGEAEQ